jgi:hypothetical protein
VSVFEIGQDQRLFGREVLRVDPAGDLRPREDVLGRGAVDAIRVEGGGGSGEYNVAGVVRRFYRGEQSAKSGVVCQKILPLSGVVIP